MAVRPLDRVMDLARSPDLASACFIRESVSWVTLPFIWVSWVGSAGNRARKTQRQLGQFERAPVGGQRLEARDEIVDRLAAGGAAILFLRHGDGLGHGARRQRLRFERVDAFCEKLDPVGERRELRQRVVMRMLPGAVACGAELDGEIVDLLRGR